MNDHHTLYSPTPHMDSYPSNQDFPRSYHHPNNSSSPSVVTRRLSQSCPVALSTYATLHMDTIGKILNHAVAVALLCDMCLFFSSFSVAYLDHHLGFNTVVCSFLLCACSVVNLLIVNNSRISALSILAPTEFMIGVAMGLSIGAAVLATLLSSTYQTGTVCDSTTSTTTTSGGRQGGNYSISNNANYDPILANTCMNHKSSLTAIWFWAGLVAWWNVVIAMLLATGRHELSARYSQYPYSYETIGGGPSDGTTTNNGTTVPPPNFDFEESFRRQQQQILGVQQAAAVRDRAAALFVGDYATVPEVTHGNTVESPPSAMSLYQHQQQPASQNNHGENARILSV